MIKRYDERTQFTQQTTEMRWNFFNELILIIACFNSSMVTWTFRKVYEARNWKFDFVSGLAG